MRKTYKIIMFVLLLLVFCGNSYAEESDKDCPKELFPYLNNIVEITDEYQIFELELLDGTISALLFQFYENSVPISYVVVSNEVSENLEIIEFGAGYAQNILGVVDALQIADNNYRLLYMGNLQYIVENNGKYFMAQNGSILELDALPQEYEAVEGEYYTYGETLNWSAVIKKEVGYASLKRGWCPNGTNLYSEYRTMSSFMSGEICSSTAAYNLTVYWYHQGYTKFDLSTTAGQNAAFQAYYSRLGKSAEIKKCRDASWKKITSAIDEGPVHVHLRESEIYGNHGVLGIGYVSFSFDSGWTSRYIAIIDGWERGARYVNYSLGIDRVDITIVEPVMAHPVIKPAV